MARLFTPLLLLASIAIPSFAADTPADAVGTTTLTFPTRSDLSSNREIATRLGLPLAEKEIAAIDYKLPDESFEVYVPSSYTGDKPYGLLVFINPHHSGRPPRQYLDAIDKHRLIYVGPNKVGNDREFRFRMGLAIDAAVNMKTRYNIDSDRVYVSGISGGGRISSMLGVCFPDVFRGGIYMIGCNYYRTVQSAEQKVPETGKFGVFRPSYRMPAPKILDLARTRSRHVLITGDHDGNREQTWLYYQGFLRDKFEHITYYQVPGMGHRPPDGDWYDAALTFLDDRPAPVSTPATAGQRPAASPTPSRRSAASTQPTDRQATAAALLAGAKLYVDNKVYERARERLKWIVAQFPETTAAAEARKLLKDLEAARP